ncbi:NAD(P)H-dependent oxidoreductase, partial [Campylobacter jejuni]|nr:NAD(P)H-dependent oxidoreductase [Campylobacter jejuni]
MILRNKMNFKELISKRRACKLFN